VIYNIPTQTAIGLLLAVLLSQLRRSVAIRSIILAPYLIANVIAAIIWFWMLDPLLGFGNVVLQAVGAGRIAFFSDQHLALPTIAAVNIWRHMGLVAILFYTGIQTISQDIYEAARIEGAGPWKNFSRITLPLLRPTLVFVLITSIIGSFQVFDSIAVTTLGGRSIQRVRSSGISTNQPSRTSGWATHRRCPAHCLSVLQSQRLCR
jgi:multiple sugar transport system permease protein